MKKPSVWNERKKAYPRGFTYALEAGLSEGKCRLKISRQARLGGAGIGTQDSSPCHVQEAEPIAMHDLDDIFC